MCRPNFVSRVFHRHLLVVAVGVISMIWSSREVIAADGWTMTLRSRAVDAADTHQPRLEKQTWAADQTAVIVCDMWDAHHCYRAVQRENELVPRMNALLTSLRDSGALVIHAPSGCMSHYADHPARIRAIQNQASGSSVAKLPDGIRSWCYAIPAEERAKYPLDQSDGGEDDTPAEHVAWEQELVSRGLNPKSPWTRQHPGLTIDDSVDFISDRGDEIWNILSSAGIRNVMLVGVHTNMCVLGRPFGLRQLKRNGKNVVLVRDMTDAMYNPKAWPYVSHFEGTALIIRHIEAYVCPTVTSDQILGGKPFQFAGQTELP